jgi:hypothetical protein
VWYNGPSRTIEQMIPESQYRSGKAAPGGGPDWFLSCSIATKGLMHDA